MLIDKGFKVLGNEPLKVVVKPKSYGYLGTDISKLLIKENIYPEFYDKDYLVLLFNNKIGKEEFKKIEQFFKNLEKQKAKKEKPKYNLKTNKIKSLTESILVDSEILNIDKCKNRILAEINFSCPPAVPIAISGEIITDEIIKECKYYGIKKLKVIKE